MIIILVDDCFVDVLWYENFNDDGKTNKTADNILEIFYA